MELIKNFMAHSNLNAEQWVELEKIKMIREIYEDSNSNDKNASGLPTLIVNMSK